MYKKIFLKLALLLSTASSYATQRGRLVAGTICRYCTTQRARYITPLLQAVREQNAIAVKELLEQGHQDLFIIDPDNNHSLAYLSLNNKNILNILYEHGARLLPTEYEACSAWKQTHPDLFLPALLTF